MEPEIKLNTSKTECRVGDVTLKLDQSVDYKSATGPVSIGKIKEFRQINEASVWMFIADMGKDSVTEWISCYTWWCQRKRGLFTSKIETTKTETTNASIEPDDSTDLPF